MSEFKQQLIDEIREHNRTASMEFLADFNEPALHHYLIHLKHMSMPRSRRAAWVRPGETSAVVTRHR